MNVTIYRAAIASYTALLLKLIYIILYYEGVLVCKVIKKSRAALASICWMQGRRRVSRAGPGTAGGPGGRDRTLAVKSKKTIS